jgi:hypothetical protein
MTPEELFRQFFGGAFGGPFGTFTAVYDVDCGTCYYGGMLTSKQAAWTQDPASSSTLAAAQEYASTSSAADAPDDVPKPHSLRAPTDPKT